MNEVQQKLADLQAKRWTLAAIADAIGVKPNAVEKWKAGDRQPANQKMTLGALERLLVKKRVPKQRRYTTTHKMVGRENV